MSKLLFESQPCTRCHGSGKYSYNQRHGTVCYGCGGKGDQLTKRGSEAQRYFRELSMVLVEDLKIGDSIRTNNVTHGGDVFTHVTIITGIDHDGPVAICNNVEHTITTVSLKSKYGETVWYTSPSNNVELVGGDRKLRIEQALAYQATLTKTGNGTKRGAALKV